MNLVAERVYDAWCRVYVWIQIVRNTNFYCNSEDLESDFEMREHDCITVLFQDEFLGICRILETADRREIFVTALFGLVFRDMSYLQPQDMGSGVVENFVVADK
eukprot:1144695_1